MVWIYGFFGRLVSWLVQFSSFSWPVLQLQLTFISSVIFSGIASLIVGGRFVSLGKELYG